MTDSTIPNIELFSDGGAQPNPGKGGYGVILHWNGHRKELSQAYELTTNNRMEILGVITGLDAIKVSANVTVYTDSKYVVDAIEQGWAKKWRAKNWYRTKSEKAINPDLWDKLLNAIDRHNKVSLNWVKGHNGHPENERCDQLVGLAIKSGNYLIDEGYLSQQEEEKQEEQSKTLF